MQTQELNFREKQVKELLLKGLSNKEIAKEMSLSIHTVKFYIERLFKKMCITGGKRAFYSHVITTLMSDLNKKKGV